LKRFILILFILFSLYSVAASAQTLRGVVTNGTTNRPSGGDEVLLKGIGNGMEDLGDTTTNAKGEFMFHTPSTQAQYVIWVKHQGVTYTNQVPPGSSTTAVQVFDSAREIKEVKVIERIIFLQTAQGNDRSLGVEELYRVANISKPPRTQSGGNNLEIYLPEGATLLDAAARFAEGMPLKTAPVPQTEKNRYAFVYPIRPGETQFELLYSIPYPGRLNLDLRSTSAGGSLAVVTPASMKFTAADNSVYQNTNSPQFPGLNLYVARNVGAQQQLGFTIEGTGVMPRGSEQATAPGGANAPQGEDNRPGGGLGVPNQRPNPLHSVQWTFLGVLCLFLAIGAVYVYLSSRNVPTPDPTKSKPQDQRTTLMDALKEEIFQLESDRLQGRLSSQEYDSAKAALDKTLQRAVQRQAGKIR
jgi:hypothetical protein